MKRAWPLHALLHSSERTLSQWATDLIQQVGNTRSFALAPQLLQELGERSEHTEPELVAVAAMPPDDLDRIPVAGTPLVIGFDRPVGPGNIGTLIRSADAFGATGLVVTGHAADPYDPKAVRASTGSLFAVPTVRIDAPETVVDWARSRGLTIVGTDESGSVDVSDTDLTGPTLLVVGNETRGMSRTWKESCDVIARLPMPGARVASSLNAATAGAIALYEASRQRGESC